MYDLKSNQLRRDRKEYSYQRSQTWFHRWYEGRERGSNSSTEKVASRSENDPKTMHTGTFKTLSDLLFLLFNYFCDISFSWSALSSMLISFPFY